jgi:hypothetical protein
MILGVPQEPTDLVIEGEQLRQESYVQATDPARSVMAGFQTQTLLSFAAPVLDEEDYFPPMNNLVATVDARVSSVVGQGVRANAGVACTSGAWLPVRANECLAQTMSARPGAWTRYSLTGVSRDSSGAALATCTVKVFLTGNDTKQFETVSDASGNWSIDVGANPGPFYFVEYKTGAPDRAGTSLNTNVPTVTS